MGYEALKGTPTNRLPALNPFFANQPWCISSTNRTGFVEQWESVDWGFISAKLTMVPSSATKAAVNVLSDTLRAESQGRIKVTNVRPTGVPGTGLGSGIINGAGITGILGRNFEQYVELISAAMSDELPPTRTDPDSIEYWAITPEQLAEAVIHAIDQPWGISISDITVRASGDLFLF